MDQATNRCRYSRKYFDYESEEIAVYKCPRQAVTESGFCEFHDPDYWREHEEEVRSKFEEMIKRAQEKPEKLLCIGFNLPTVVVRGEFKKPVYFLDAKFHNEADFRNAEFYREADFRNAEFHHKADFSCAQFYRKADFSYVVFNGRTMFIETRLIFNVFDYIRDKGIYDNLEHISFMGAKFLKPSEVLFDHVYLGRVSFINCNIERVNFRNVIWKEGRGGRYVVFDEELLVIKANPELVKKLGQGELKEEDILILRLPFDVFATTLDNVLSVYRRLRENYDYNLKYIESGKFFVSEMEVRRLYREVDIEIIYNDWFRRNFSITNFYKLLCLYGENHIWPIVWALIVVLTSTVLRLLLLYLEFSSLDILYNINTILKAFEDSVRAFFQMGGVTGIDLAERLLSIPILGALVLSLRRKFERRFRH